MTEDEAEILLRRWREYHHTRAGGLMVWHLFALLMQVLAGWVLCVMIVCFAFYLHESHFNPLCLFGALFVIFAPPLWAPYFHPILSTILYLLLLLRPALRSYCSTAPQAVTGRLPESGRPEYHSGMRQNNYRRGLSLGVLWDFVCGLFSAPFRRGRAIAECWRQWHRSAPDIPAGAAEEIARLFPNNDAQTWTPLKECPGLCPLLEELLTLRVIRLRENANTGMEARLDNDLEKFIRRFGEFAETDLEEEVAE